MIPPKAGTAIAPLVPDISIPKKPANATMIKNVFNFKFLFLNKANIPNTTPACPWEAPNCPASE